MRTSPDASQSNARSSREELSISVAFTQPQIRDRIEIQAVAEPTRKRRGEASEAAFLAGATHLGFTVCLPWGDSERYDSVVDLGHGFLRVQVKSAALRRIPLSRQNRRSQRHPLHRRRNRFLRSPHRSPGHLVHHSHPSHRPPQGHPLLSPYPPQIPRPIRKIPRSLVPPGLQTPSPRMERHPRRVQM